MVHWGMVNIGIENVNFPAKFIELIEFRRNEIKMNIIDYQIGTDKKIYAQFNKWVNLCGTMDSTIIEYVSIGAIHINKKFLFSCRISLGIPSKTATNIGITLTAQSDQFN